MFTKNIVSSCLTLEEIRLIKHSRITELWAFCIYFPCINSFQFKTARTWSLLLSIHPTPPWSLFWWGCLGFYALDHCVHTFSRQLVQEISNLDHKLECVSLRILANLSRSRRHFLFLCKFGLKLEWYIGLMSWPGSKGKLYIGICLVSTGPFNIQGNSMTMHFLKPCCYFWKLPNTLVVLYFSFGSSVKHLVV